VADGGHDAVDEPAADESSTAKWISIIAGAAMIVMSAVTNYEDGFLSHAISTGVNAWLPFWRSGSASWRPPR
jgi:hypothetical protein